MRSIISSVRALAARAGAAALAVPIVVGGAAPVSATFVSHAMTPAIGSGAQYESLGETEDLTTVLFGCQNPRVGPPTCYAPSEIRAAYDIKPLIDAGFTGTGRTIVIIDAFQSPTLLTDLAKFDKMWQLNDPWTLNVVVPWSPDNTPTPFDPNDGNQVVWSAEISVDVEWAHAIAPGATIDLVLAKSADDADMLSATKYAIEHNLDGSPGSLGDVISQSFGEAESCADPKLIQQEHALFGEASDKGITLVASSGDQGAAQPTCDGKSFRLSASTPASDPEVTAVGGTHLITTGTLAAGTLGTYQSEAVWSTGSGATGGGFSAIYRRPGYQAPLQDNNKQRGLPDVALNGDLNSGVIVVWGGRSLRFGGSSAGAPQWAGIVALADQKGGQRLGPLNKSLYHIGKSDAYAPAFHDITAGDSSFSCMVNPCKGDFFQGFAATPGWDAATGLGTPDVANLIPLLI